MWEHRGQTRPSFAEKPGSEQESVWDYPRPPILERSDRSVLVRVPGKVVGRSTETYRVLETASPPGYYLPEKDIDWSVLVRTAARSSCESKGLADYWTLRSDPFGEPVAWSYRNPKPDFEVLRGYVSFYPGRLECSLDGERVRPQPGDFYGGWITSEIVGPFKGEPGTEYW